MKTKKMIPLALTLALLLPIGAAAGEAIEIKSEPCKTCKGQGYTENYNLCPACRKRKMEIFALREKEIRAELRAASKDPRARIDNQEVRTRMETEDLQSRLPKCATCDAAERTRNGCPACGGRGVIYFWPDGRQMKSSDIPENELSRGLYREAKIKELKTQIQDLERRLAEAKSQLRAAEAGPVPIPPPKETFPPPSSIETPVEVNPREKVSVKMPLEKL